MTHRPAGWESRSVPDVVTLTDLTFLDADEPDRTGTLPRISSPGERIAGLRHVD
jgi:hypothetical protein